MTAVDKFRNVAAALAIPAIPGIAHSQSLLAQAMFRTESVAEQQPGTYEVERDGTKFSLDQSGPATLMRFDGGKEIYALSAQPGPRGDQILKTDHGYTVLRITTNDSVIVYSNAYPTGAPAAFVGASTNIAPPAPLKGALSKRLEDVAAKMTKALGRDVTFIAPATASSESGFFAEAADRVADGIIQSRASLPARGALTIRLMVSKMPGAAFESDELRVGLNPHLSYMGRPSSMRISQAITRAQSIRPSEVRFSFPAR
ncbi:MAG: DUF4908 domain-containing protein [Caulobacterales bacterium]